MPAAAGELTDPAVALNTALAFVAFCLASSAAYLLNDLSDRELDRSHPVKRRRAIASGELSERTALAGMVVLAAGALAVAAVPDPALLGAVAGYMALTTLYSRRLKHEPIFDIASVAAGFFLRAVAGGLASDIFVSRWFLIVAAGGSLFVVAGKRYAEMRAAGRSAPLTRRVLASYSENYLESVLTVAAGVTVLAYFLWAFEEHGELSSSLAPVSVVPFVLAIMRYGLLVDQGHGEEPEEIFLRDRTLQLLVAAWLASVGIAALAG